MPFQQGNKISQGRPKGTPNRITRELREILREFVHEELKDIQALRDRLEPRDRMRLLSALLPFVLPKAETEPEGEGNHPDTVEFQIGDQIITIHP